MQGQFTGDAFPPYFATQEDYRKMLKDTAHEKDIAQQYFLTYTKKLLLS